MRSIPKNKKIRIAIFAAVLLILLAAAAAVFSFGGTYMRQRQHIAAGDRYLEEVDYAQAIVEYTAALDISPKNQEAQEKLEQTCLLYADSIIQSAALTEEEYQTVLEILNRSVRVTGSEALSEKAVEIESILKETEGEIEETQGTQENGSMEEEPDSVNEQTEDQIAFEEMTVMDNDICSIRLTGMELNGGGGCTFHAQYENKSADKQYDFFVSAAINGVQGTARLESTEFGNVVQLPAGERTELEIVITDNVPAETSMGDYTDIELTFSVCEDGNWIEATVEETIHIYPYGEEEAVQYARKEQSSDHVIIDNEYITITVIGYEKTEDNCYINLFLVNKSDSDIHLYEQDILVNGNEMNGYWGIDSGGEALYAGKCKYSDICIYDTALTGMDLSDVEEIRMHLWALTDGLNELVNEEILLNP